MRCIRPSLFAFTVTALACSSGERQDAASAADSVFTPRQYSVADLYRNTDYFGASFSPKADRILVSSNASGVYNAYAIPMAGGDPEPLTKSTDNAIFAVSWFPADDRVLYSSDRGGNELSHLYVRLPDGSAKDLTPGEKHKAQFAGWSGDDRSFFVSSNERDPRFFDLYEYATDGYARKLFYRNTEGYSLGPISRDKRYIALIRPKTSNDSDIFLHDRKAGTTTLITKHTGQVSYSPQDFTPDGKGLLVTSDSGREFAALQSHDIATGRRTTVYELTWDVLGAGYSKGGKYLIVGVNQDSRPDARLLDAATLKPVELAGMPSGLVRPVEQPGDLQAVVRAKAHHRWHHQVLSADIGVQGVGHPPWRLAHRSRPEIVRGTAVARVEGDRGLVARELDALHQAGRHPRQLDRFQGGRVEEPGVGPRVLVDADDQILAALGVAAAEDVPRQLVDGRPPAGREVVSLERGELPPAVGGDQEALAVRRELLG